MTLYPILRGGSYHPYDHSPCTLSTSQAGKARSQCSGATSQGISTETSETIETIETIETQERLETQTVDSLE